MRTLCRLFRPQMLIVLPFLLVTGCIMPIPTIPLNAPGYGHTYQVLDHKGKPAESGLLLMHSHYRGVEEMVNCYPIHEGRVAVPLRIGTRMECYSLMSFPVWSCIGKTRTLQMSMPWCRVKLISIGICFCQTVPTTQDGLKPAPNELRLVNYLLLKNWTTSKMWQEIWRFA